MTYLKILS